ncbi:MAG: 4Fe-4S cluster-binding domain-containing protein [Sedimentisphaerales bacterium]|nr:4Fe-4S cluster-binding domain-containing protein [Sedimentisphaerales bacterium]
MKPLKNIGDFSPTARKLWAMTNPCVLCPRKCRVKRSSGEIGPSTSLRTGFCGIGDMPVVSSVGPHFGEESVLVGRPFDYAQGKGGSGTIFFAGCNLGCVFCQNYDISHFRQGRKVTISELADFMLDLQDRGCSNINFVTPTHQAAAIVAGIETARKRGLNLPTVYNSGGYDSVEALKLLDGYIDIYMPDMKFSGGAAAKEFANAPDYPEVNFAAVKEMHRQVGDLQIENGLAKRGLLVRHLVLPNKLAGSLKVIDFLAEHVSRNTAINVMNQYRPCFKADEHPEINRRPTSEEVEDVRQYALKKGLNVIA